MERSIIDGVAWSRLCRLKRCLTSAKTGHKTASQAYSVERGKMEIDFIVPAALWLSGLNLIVALSLKRQRLSYIYMLSPSVISKLQRQDWGLVAVLCLVVFVVGGLLAR